MNARKGNGLFGLIIGILAGVLAFILLLAVPQTLIKRKIVFVGANLENALDTISGALLRVEGRLTDVNSVAEEVREDTGEIREKIETRAKDELAFDRDVLVERIKSLDERLKRAEDLQKRQSSLAEHSLFKELVSEQSQIKSSLSAQIEALGEKVDKIGNQPSSAIIVPDIEKMHQQTRASLEEQIKALDKKMAGIEEFNSKRLDPLLPKEPMPSERFVADLHQQTRASLEEQIKSLDLKIALVGEGLKEETLDTAILGQEDLVVYTIYTMKEWDTGAVLEAHFREDEGLARALKKVVADGWKVENQYHIYSGPEELKRVILLVAKQEASLPSEPAKRKEKDCWW